MIDLDAVASQEFILGSFLRDGATIVNVEAMNNIPKEAFTVPMLRDIFTVCKSITDKAEDMDILHVDDCLTRMLTKRKAGEYEGQYNRIASLHTNSMKGFSIDAHVKKLVKSYKLRIAQQSMYTIGQAIQSGSDIDEVVDTVEGIISQLRMAGQTYQTQHISELVECYADTLEARYGELGIRTGFEDCDKLIGKVMPGNLIILSARPGQGKTEFACAWAVNAAVNQKRNILVFSLEMQTGEIMDRFVALDGNMPISTLDSIQSMSASEWGTGAWGKVASALSRLHPVNISIHDEPAITLSKMRQVIKDTERKTGKLDMIVVDYLQLMKDPSAKGRIEEVSNVSRGLKEMAKEFKFPVMALAQLNRECEKHDREPRPSDIAESGQIEKDADKIIFLHCPNKSEPSQPNYQLSKVIFSKVRQGKTGAAVLEFKGGHFYNSCSEFKDNSKVEEEEKTQAASKYVGKTYKK